MTGSGRKYSIKSEILSSLKQAVEHNSKESKEFIKKILTGPNFDTTWLQDLGELVLIAVRKDNLELVELLLSLKLSPNVKCPSTGAYPLHIAIENVSSKMVKLLLKYEADPNLADSKGKLPIELAAASSGSRNWSSASYSTSSMTRWVIVYDLAPLTNDANKKGYALWFALMESHINPDAIQVAKLLLVCKANPNVYPETHDVYETSLSFALSNPETCNKEFVELLLKNGADTDQIAPKRSTSFRKHQSLPIYIAAEKKKWDIVTLLAGYIKDFYIKDIEEVLIGAVLNLAIEAKTPESLAAAKHLIQKGAAARYGHFYPFEFAAEKNQWDIVNEFLKSNKKISPSTRGSVLLRAIETNSAESLAVVPFLLAAGADIKIQNSKGFSVLHLAATMGNADLLAQLLACKADPSLVDNNNNTPLQHLEKNKPLTTAANWSYRSLYLQKLDDAREYHLYLKEIFSWIIHGHNGYIENKKNDRIYLDALPEEIIDRILWYVILGTQTESFFKQEQLKINALNNTSSEQLKPLQIARFWHQTFDTAKPKAAAKKVADEKMKQQKIEQEKAKLEAENQKKLKLQNELDEEKCKKKADAFIKIYNALEDTWQMDTDVPTRMGGNIKFMDAVTVDVANNANKQPDGRQATAFNLATIYFKDMNNKDLVEAIYAWSSKREKTPKSSTLSWMSSQANKKAKSIARIENALSSNSTSKREEPTRRF